MDRIHKTDCENIEYVEPSLIALLVQVWEIRDRNCQNASNNFVIQNYVPCLHEAVKNKYI